MWLCINVYALYRNTISLYYMLYIDSNINKLYMLPRTIVLQVHF